MDAEKVLQYRERQEYEENQKDREVLMFMHYFTSRGIRIPDPQNYPKTFKWYVKMYKYYQTQKVK